MRELFLTGGPASCSPSSGRRDAGLWRVTGTEVASLTSRGSRRECSQRHNCRSYVLCGSPHYSIHPFIHSTSRLLNPVESPFETGKHRLRLEEVTAAHVPAPPASVWEGMFGGMGLSMSRNQWNSCYDSGKKAWVTITLAKSSCHTSPAVRLSGLLASTISDWLWL